MFIYVDTGAETFTQFFYNASGESFKFDIPTSTFYQISSGLNPINYVATTSVLLVLTKDPATIIEVDSILKDSVSGQVLFVEDSGTIGELKQESTGGPVYIQACHEADQTFAVVNTAQDVLFGHVQSSNGITVTADKTFKLPEDGFYSITLTAQEKSDGGVNKELIVWMKLNGTNIDCTAQFQTDDNGEGSEISVTYVGPFVKDDEIVIGAQVNSTNVHMHFIAAAGSVPDVPSSRISIIKL